MKTAMKFLTGLLLLTVALWLAVAQDATAVAQPAMTQDDTSYVTALAAYDIYPGTTAADMASSGRLIAIDVQRGFTPQHEADLLWQGGYMDMNHAHWVVSQAVAVFAPEQFSSVPKYFYWPVLVQLGVVK